MDQHPDVTAYKLMTESLKADVELAHKQMRHTTEMTEKKAHELEAVYRQLQAQHNGKHISAVNTTPVHFLWRC